MTAQKIERPPFLGCGNNPCFIEPVPKGHMATQGMCHCLDGMAIPKRGRLMRRMQYLNACHDKLVEALRPFADVETYDNKDHELCALFFEAGDIRRAQALLREIEGGEEE
jgi:hypothetical protein